jgi:hypothetical protein
MINAYTILMLISLKMPLENTVGWWDKQRWIFERWKDVCLRFLGSTVFHRSACKLVLFSSFASICAFLDLRIVLYTLTKGAAGSSEGFIPV